MTVPETRYVRVGQDRIAYQVFGAGPIDLLYVPSMGDCIDLRWDYPLYADFLQRLASFSRLIQFDRRGLGASDGGDDGLPTWERWADDARAVLDAVGSEQAAIFGWSDAGPTAMLFAATHPTRTRALILANTTACPGAGAMGPAEMEALWVQFEEGWGTPDPRRSGNPELGRDPAYGDWEAKINRLSLSPRQAGKHLRWWAKTDVRLVLPSISVPTLVLHRRDIVYTPVPHGRYLAEHIPNARLVLVPGTDMFLFGTASDEVIAEIEEFLTGTRSMPRQKRTLATVLFTDIVDSTGQAARLGDERWRGLLESHAIIARTVVGQHQGRLVKMTGDGILATFDGPGRAIQCARSLRDALNPLGIEIRAGLHAGEIELLDEDIGGIAVHVAARVLEHAAAGELLASAAIPLLVVGSGVEFIDRGEHELKGVPDRWHLFAVAG